jgi:hypothetical protein
MKKLILFLVLSVAILAITFTAYLYWAKSTFVAREIKRRTGAQEVHVLDQAHAGDHWYGKAEIDQQTGKQLLARFVWERGFERKVALAGRVVSDRPPDCSTCLYRIESDPHDRQYHPYNYTVYVLSSDLKVLEVYEQFGS